jgi:hypothetical protein
MFKKPATRIPVLIDTATIDLVTFKGVFSSFRQFQARLYVLAVLLEELTADFSTPIPDWPTLLGPAAGGGVT